MAILEQKFLDNLKALGVSQKDHILLAVSGGCDSMVMLHLFTKVPNAVAVAHVNYQLRGEESDKDEDLVKSFCDRSNIAFHVLRADTRTYASDHRVGIQEAAREIRYDWFNALMRQHDYDLLATAHHLHDSYETLFMNLIRGTGVSGLTGIPSRRQDIIRPFYTVSAIEIREYAQKSSINYREDLSNQAGDYLRNRIRNEVMPMLKDIKPDLDQSLLATLESMKNDHALIKEAIDRWSANNVHELDNKTLVYKKTLSTGRLSIARLFHILSKYQFNADQCKDILASINNTGRLFESDTHILNIDREHLVVSQKPLIEEYSIEVLLPGSAITPYGQLEVSSTRSPEFVGDPNIEFIQLPVGTRKLTVRNWRAGDRLQPLGLQGTKKVQDILVDQKIPRVQKGSVPVVVLDDDIVWLAGLKLNDKFKVQKPSPEAGIYKLEWKPGISRSN